MPVMDGYEATGRIREAESRCGIRRTPIIALTAHAVEEEARRTVLAGMDLHLTKPMERRSIAEAVRRVRGGQGPGMTTTTLPAPPPCRCIDQRSPGGHSTRDG